MPKGQEQDGRHTLRQKTNLDHRKNRIMSEKMSENINVRKNRKMSEKMSDIQNANFTLPNGWRSVSLGEVLRELFRNRPNYRKEAFAL